MKLSKSSLKVKKILEIGCGEGHNMNLLTKKKGNKVIGIDLSQETIKMTKRRYPHLDVHQMNAEKLKFRNQEFDEVYALEVLEHVDKLETVVREIKRVLSKTGKLFISVPYEKSEYMLLKIRPTYFKEIHHVRIFKGNDLERFMKKEGFKLVAKKGQDSLSHIYIIYQFLTTKDSDSQLSIGDWRNSIFSKAVFVGVGFFQPFILKTPAKYIPIWIVTLPIGYGLSYFGNKIFPKSIYYEYARAS